MDQLAAHRAERAHNRLACTIGQARMHATPSEQQYLYLLLAEVDDGRITADQAQQLAANVQRQQQARRAA